MPAPPLENTLEGGSDGVDITPANSGGASGDALDLASTAGTTTMNYDTSDAHDSLVSMEIATGATPGNAYRGWDALGAITGPVYTRFYLWVPNFPVGSQWMVRWQDDAGVRCAGFLLNTAGMMRGENAAGTSLTAGTVAITAAQWVRVEVRIDPSTTVGEFHWKRWDDPESTGTPDDEVSLTNQVLGANIDEVRFGALSGTSANANQTYRMDDLAVATDDWIGPVAGAAGPSQRFMWLP